MRGEFEQQKHIFLDATVFKQTPYVLTKDSSGQRRVGILQRDSCICKVSHEVLIPEMPLSRLEKAGEGLVGIVLKDTSTDFAFIHPLTGLTKKILDVYGRTTDITYDESTQTLTGIDDAERILRVYQVIFDSNGIPCDVKQRKNPSINAKPFYFERKIRLQLQSLTGEEAESVRALVHHKNACDNL